MQARRGSSCLDREMKHCLASLREGKKRCCAKSIGENPLPRPREQKKSSTSEGKTGTQCVPDLQMRSTEQAESALSRDTGREGRQRRGQKLWMGTPETIY